jgi:hypothetical protein
MNKGQFAALTAALGLATMAGSGYIAYASSNSHASASGSGSSANGASGQGGGASPAPSAGSGAGGVGVATQTQGSGATAKAGDGTVQQCGNSDIAVASADSEGAAGHISLLLEFTNTSGHACVLRGYPGASLLGPKGKDLLDAQRTLTGPSGGAVGLSSAPRVLLEPNAIASAVLEWSDVPTGSGADGGCQVQDAAALDVTPPNTTQSTAVDFAAGTEVCAEFQVHPVLLGVNRTP